MNRLLAGLAAGVVALAVGAAVATGAVSFSAPPPTVVPTVVAVKVIATETPDLSLGTAAMQELAVENCNCGK